MRFLGLILGSALIASACTGSTPMSPTTTGNDAVVSTSDAAVSSSKSGRFMEPRTCVFDSMQLFVEPGGDRGGHFVYAVYGTTDRCAAPTWSVIERDVRVTPTPDGFAVQVSSDRRGFETKLTAVGPNGVTASVDLKF